MAFDPLRHHRRSIRLKDYDYSQAGAYFVTICVQGRECLFGDVVNHEMHYNDAGKMICAEWETLTQRFPTVELDEWVAMPNHLHGIIGIVDSVRASLVDTPDRAGMNPAPTSKSTLGDIVGAFKSLSTHQYIEGVHNKGWLAFYKKLWQRNYHEHIVRNERELEAIRKYIRNNPKQWMLDRDHPSNVPPNSIDDYLRDAGIT